MIESDFFFITLSSRKYPCDDRVKWGESASMENPFSETSGQAGVS